MFGKNNHIFGKLKTCAKAVRQNLFFSASRFDRFNLSSVNFGLDRCLTLPVYII